MPTVTVGQDDCKPAKYGERLETRGLDTCIGIVAYGLPYKKGGVNKVMAHCSPGNEDAIIGNLFVTAVRNSGMTLYGICMSCPKPDRNNSGPRKITDKQIRDALAESRGIRKSDVTQAMIDEQRQALAQRLTEAQDRAEGHCIEAFGMGIMSHPRSTSRANQPYPYGSLVATASPGGEVEADGHKMADIPDWTEPAAAPAPDPNVQYYGGGGGGSSSGQYYQDQYYASGSSAAYYGSGSGSGSGGGGHATYAMRPKGGADYGASYSARPSSGSARHVETSHHSSSRRADTGHSESRREGKRDPRDGYGPSSSSTVPSSRITSSNAAAAGYGSRSGRPTTSTTTSSTTATSRRDDVAYRGSANKAASGSARQVSSSGQKVSTKRY